MEKIGAGVEQELPADLLFDILANLPVKSLCRFRCVSKLWRSVIADPRFVDAHHACSAARPEVLMIFRDRNRGELIRRACTFKLDTAGMELRSPRNRRDPARTFRAAVSLQSSGSERGYTSHQAGGLFCRGCSDSVRVWNPTTRESLDIETPEADGELFGNINYLGFDPVEKKHKVLNILREYNTGKAVSSRVFILEENCWRTTANAYPSHSRVRRSEDVICVDGIIFFAIDSSEQKLTAFHVRSETFEVISLPPGRDWRKGLIEFTGRATVVYYPSFSDPGEEITLWMLEDFRKQAWTRKTCVIPDCRLRQLNLRGGTPTGKLLFTGEGDLTEPLFLLLCNVESNAARRIEVRGLYEQMRRPFPTEVHVLVESLKSPGGASSLTSPTHIKILNRVVTF